VNDALDAARQSASAYDRIAHLYDVDMARSMPFDDVAFYRERAMRYGGHVLELGCGNGRILLDLLVRGIDALGIDASANMLAQLARKAAARGLPAPVARMDARSLALAGPFDCVLCPYSLITYMLSDDDVARLLAEARRVLRPGGALVADAFVPQFDVADGVAHRDFRRAFARGELERTKRITRQSDDINFIEREYRVMAEDGRVLETVTTAEWIRPFTPLALKRALAQAGFLINEETWDYGASRAANDARFFAVVAEK